MAEIRERQTPLNTEPTDPRQRAENNLPPRSYADAAQGAAATKTSQNGNAYEGSNGLTLGGPEKAPSNTTNIGKKPSEEKAIFEKLSNGNGSVLTSVRPGPSYEANLSHNKASARRAKAVPENHKPQRQDVPKSQLKSGRKAGAGWQQSA